MDRLTAEFMTKEMNNLLEHS